MSSEISPAEQQRLFILGEFYFKKGNFDTARKIFEQLVQISPDIYLFSFFLGRIEVAEGNYQAAVLHFEKTRSVNPFHQPSLLLLSKSYSELDNMEKALECLVDVYLLCKETKDSQLENYKKEIRVLGKRLPEMNDLQKNQLIKDRLKKLYEHLNQFESIQRKFSTAEIVEEPKSIEIPPESTPFVPSGTIEYEHTTQEWELTPPPYPLPQEKHEDEEVDEISMPNAGVVLNADFGLQNHPNINFTRHLLFKSLSVQEIEKIGKFSSIQTFAAGETIHQPLEPIFGFSCLLEGKIQILHQGIELLELQSGSIIDEAELCYGDKYFFESKALSPSTILVINKAALLSLCKRRHELAVHFLWHFYKSLTLKVSAVLDNIVRLNLSKETEWSIDRMWEVAQQRKVNELELDFLVRKCKKLTKPKNSFIYTNQELTKLFYILLEGEVELEHPVSKDRITIASGEIFSEMALISDNFQHRMSAKVVSEQAVLLQISRKELSELRNPGDRDNYRMMELLWNVFSKKYFEFVNFYFHLKKS